MYDHHSPTNCAAIRATISNQEQFVPETPNPGQPDHLDVLAGAAETLAIGDDLDATLGSLLRAAIAATGADSGAIFLQDPDRPELDPAVAVGIDEPVFDRLRGSVGGTDDPVGATARDRAALDVDAGSSLRGGFVAETNSAIAAFRPLAVNRGGVELPLGVLALGWKDAIALTPTDTRLIEAVAHLTSVAIDHGRLGSLVAERSEWFERMAHSDPLTGLANQRTLARVVELELARAGRQGGEVSIALFDVDDFKQTNEAAGHQAGDDILRAVAAVLAESVRLVDTVARYGGDEFVLIAPGSAGLTVARRVLDGVAALPPVGGHAISVCASLARFPSDGRTADELLSAAEHSLAAAKTKGPGTLQEAASQPAG
jgi:diguanylate cyclase (GGDEF)-like protein